MQTVVGIFDSAAQAQQAAQRLSAAGFSLEDVDVANSGAIANGSSSSSSNYQNTSGTAVEGAADAVGRTADQAGNALSQAARPDRNPSDYSNTSGTAVEGAADAAGRTGDSIGNFFSNLFGGDDADDTQRYSHVARQSGSSTVTVHVQSAEHARKAAEIMDEAGAVDVDQRAA